MSIVLGLDPANKINLVQGGAGRPVIGQRHRVPVVRLKCDNPACANEFLEYKRHVARKNYCSRECYCECRLGSDNPKWRGGMRTVHCKFCKKPFTTYPSSTALLCSPRCRSLAHRNPFSEAEALQIIEQIRTCGMPFYKFAASLDYSEYWLRKKLKAAAPDDFTAVVESGRLKWHEIYRRGRNFEYEVRRDLISRDYVCMVSPRSAGAADLLAVKHGRILLVQCKLYGEIRKHERKSLDLLSAHAGGEPIVACKEDGRIRYYKLNGVRRRKLTVII